MREVIRNNRVASTIIVIWLLMAVVGPFLPLSPNEIDLDNKLVGPNSNAILGYDHLGRPILERLIKGASISFFVAILVVTISATMGTLIGAMSGYFGGVVDQILVRIFDIFLAFPGILLIIALASVLGSGLDNLIFAMSIAGWVGFARIARAQVLALKHRDHVQAAIVLGTRPFKIIVRHLVPLISAPIIVEATFGIASVIIAEAGMSFLGLGVQPPTASWGSMIRDGTANMLNSAHMVLAPGLTLMLVVLAVNQLGDSLRDWFDVKSRLK
jgi:peptide/nickel transport system permease protein